MKLDKEAPLVSQLAGAIVTEDLERHARDLEAALTRQDWAMADALGAVDQVRAFVGTPEHILGSSTTKHGEIAEQVEVGIRNARDLLRQQAPTATFEGVGRTAPTDYMLGDLEVQSKFYNGVSANLQATLDHLKNYPKFGQQGHIYHIPKDHMEVIHRVMRGDPPLDLSAKTIRAIEQKVHEIEQLSGQRPFDETVQPGISSYAEVQQGRIHHTLDGHEREFRIEDQELRAKLHKEHTPGLSDMAGAAAKGAAVGAAVRLASALYQKHRQGKHPFRGAFTAEDWRDVGLDAVTGALQGGLAAGAIYGLTQYADLAAPFAGAFVSSAMAVGSLTAQYAAGKLTLDEFVELGLIACSEGAVVGLATAVGQALIPIPALGAVVGAVAGRWLLSLAKGQMELENAQLTARLEAWHREAMERLDEAYRTFVTRMLASYDQLGQLVTAAFAPDLNCRLRLAASIELAVAMGVPDDQILRSSEDLDRFMGDKPNPGKCCGELPETSGDVC